MMKPVAVVTVAIAVLAMVLIVSQPAVATTLFSSSMVGADEAAPAAVSTGAHGFFFGTLNDAETQLDYALLYFGLEGGALLFAHIHLGQPGVNGGVAVFLCGGTPPQSNKPPCPPSGTVITGSIVATDVIGPGAQGISAGEFSELVRAMKAGLTYSNVHTTNFGSGEIRGQIK
jgi:CHRD domain-containing protein